ncbi:hypothetical protein AYI68_g4410 [Smittium mucronatum]|uniref:Uncharacterized protein n=1 Tax=Smittium mucronatum TaxID=133383 RepID=A0A1R0GXB6_9FUNG|nr:hypothetical protein AYI68_g4410 [Smittium mucronatum]
MEHSNVNAENNRETTDLLELEQHKHQEKKPVNSKTDFTPKNGKEDSASGNSGGSLFNASERCKSSNSPYVVGYPPYNNDLSSIHYQIM